MRKEQTESQTTGGKPRREKVAPGNIVYESDDLRHILAERLAEQPDPYDLLLKAGVIKNAAEFWDIGNK